MPITKRAMKKLHHDKKRTKQNKSVRDNLKKIVKAARNKASVEAVSAAFKTLDKAAKRGIIHKNRASRLKSRLAKLLKR